MRHLNEEEFIDQLMGEPIGADAEAHLRACELCQEQLGQLGGGLEAVRAIAPAQEEPLLPRFSAKLFRRRVKMRRWLAVAAAALILASLLGMRVEIGSNGFSMQFSLFRQADVVQKNQERITALENRLADAIAIQNTMTQYQLDARFNALYQERDQDLGQFAQAVEKKLHSLELTNAQLLTHIRQDLKNTPRQTDLGKWQ